MNIKNISTFIIAVIMLFSLTSCRSSDKPDVTEEFVSTTADAEETTNIISDEPVADTTTVLADTSETTEDITASNDADPAEWSTDQIVEAYKNAAKKSNPKVKSAHSIALKKISVNNGEYEGLFEFITPIMSKLLANNSEDKDGITGGFNNLTAADVASAKAYKSGNNTVIEMVMKEQTSGAKDDALSGTVGHAITAVGDISVVTKQLTDLGLPLELSEKDTKIYYTNPTVKVLINSSGEIVNGTWCYTVDININNYKAFGKAVETTSVIMDNTLTVNGGFKK